MIGVILAAGEATRLPNKPLLPLRGGKILIESALDFLRPCDEIVVVVREGSVLPLVGLMRGWRGTISFVPQQGQDVGSAIRSGVQLLDDGDQVVVAFADNLYGHEDRVVLQQVCARAHMNIMRFATVRQPAVELTSQLDYWCTTTYKWCVRGGIHGSKEWALAGFLCAQAVIFKQFGDTMCGSLNRLDFRPEMITCAVGWRDLGTVESYREYLLEEE